MTQNLNQGELCDSAANDSTQSTIHVVIEMQRPSTKTYSESGDASSPV